MGGPNTLSPNLSNEDFNVSNRIFLSHISNGTVNQTVTPINATITRYGNGTFIFNGIKQLPNNTVRLYDGSIILFSNGTKITLVENSIFSAPARFPLGKTTITLGYTVCYNLPPGARFLGEGLISECYGSPISNKLPSKISYTNYTYSGINITFLPKNELLSPNQSASVNATISVGANATVGTYLLHTYMSGACCEGAFCVINDRGYTVCR